MVRKRQRKLLRLNSLASFYHLQYQLGLCLTEYYKKLTTVPYPDRGLCFSSNNQCRGRQFRAGTDALGCCQRHRFFSASCPVILSAVCHLRQVNQRIYRKEESQRINRWKASCQLSLPHFLGETISFPRAPPTDFCFRFNWSHGQFSCKGVWGGIF